MGKYPLETIKTNKQKNRETLETIKKLGREGNVFTELNAFMKNATQQCDL